MDEKHKVSVPQINRYKIISWTKHVYNCINTLQSKGSLKNIRVKDFKIKNDTPIITIFLGTSKIGETNWSLEGDTEVIADLEKRVETSVETLRVREAEKEPAGKESMGGKV
ncbi:unnamed protein product [Meganyctiphanes norvegica]|uniref:Uncharacterized protein n=1 Tax=Meganyctiphanes norvegica TaxID=48144 RepID=A0AAV2SVC8_MEGNR